MPAHLSSAEDVNAALEQVAYLADEGLATATFLALELDRPLFLEGEPGVGAHLRGIMHELCAALCGSGSRGFSPS